MAIMFGLTFTSCSHQSFKGYEFSMEENDLWTRLMNAQIVKSVLDNDDSAFYGTEEDENGNLLSVQVVSAAKIAKAKYVNSSAPVAAGDFVMLWKDGLSVYFVKCDETLPFQSRVKEARKWCVQNLDFGKTADNKDLPASSYPRLIRLN